MYFIFLSDVHSNDVSNDQFLIYTITNKIKNTIIKAKFISDQFAKASISKF